MQYAIARKDGGVMIMHTSGNASPAAEIAKWPPELQALINVNDIRPVSNIPADRTSRNAWTVDTVT